VRIEIIVLIFAELLTVFCNYQTLSGTQYPPEI
jgi:hypothetical protein